MTLRASPVPLSERGYLLIRDETPVGWIRVGAIGFGAFPSRESADDAARRALPALLRWYRLRWRAEPLPWEEPLSSDLAVREGATIVGRLVTTEDRPRWFAEGFGFELRIPTGLWVATGEKLARMLVTAIHDLPARRGITADDRPPPAA